MDFKDIKEAGVVKRQDSKQFVRPPFEPLQDLKDGINYVLFNPSANMMMIPILVLLDSMALKIIISNVAYTEIDYKAYMEQIEMIQNGAKNYSIIEGGTGPLVYPAGHVLIYKFMNWVTNGMETIHYGQNLFRFLYLFTLICQLVLFQQLELPPWCIVLACLSKRLHSIYVLRLFNDCFTTAFVVLVVLLLTIATRITTSTWKLRLTVLASLLYSMAVSIKMNALLYLPAVLVSIYLNNEGNLLYTLGCGMIMFVWQILVAFPFLKEYPIEYLYGAFNFSRQFMFKWSVNWQMLEEKGFQSKWFHLSLLVSQILSISAIILCYYPQFLVHVFYSIRHPMSKQDLKLVNSKRIVPFILVVTNFIGIIFSRSLHYQFLSWYHWTIPILMSYSKMPVYVGPIWYLLHEYCWNFYPPNARASSLLFGLNTFMLLLIVFSQICLQTVQPQPSNTAEATKKKEN